ncbi:serine hydrolase [Alcanivorax sp. 1008]|uniref:serine hydrolase domain-containing protein n=1 Tax=Alcanivorax sp. 1008 TaxID=2816853 RepID=UPI001D32C5E3|nr:serine hydrolase [Alcanivorax sp. 1008]MCC1495404.1 serine hydrolase [Alcanivorax sp. 1008]
MKRPILALLIFGLLLAASLSWWYRPWATYSPNVMTRLLAPEYRLHNFRKMESVFPFRTIPASNEPFTFPSGQASLPQQFVHDGRMVDTFEFMLRTQTTGLMVLHQGTNMFEQYYLEATQKDRFTSWSVAKSVVGTLTAIALKDGHIASLDDQVKQYVSELDGAAWGEVPIRDLLRMASGIQFDEIYDEKFSDINMLFYRTFLLGEGVRDVIADLPAEGPSGESFHYISPNSQILGWVLESAVGKPVSEYAAEALWQPLGMQDEAIWNLDQGGVELAFCCLNMTLRDYSKLGQLYLQQGVWKGKQLLPEGWVQQASHRPEPWLAAGNGYPERGYGYHLWVPKNPDEEFFFNGVWGQTVWVSEKHHIVITKTSVDPLFREHMAEVISFMRAVSQHVSGQAEGGPG